MGDTLRSILIRLVAYVAVAIAAGLLFLAGATIYQLMWPRPVVPLSQMSFSTPTCNYRQFHGVFGHPCIFWTTSEV